MNVSKTQLMVLSRRCRKCEAERIRIQLDGSILVSDEKVRYLGVDIDRNFTLKDQVCKVRQSCLSSLSRVSSFLPFETKKRLYNTLVLPHMDYCCVVWGNVETRNRTVAKLWDAANHFHSTTCL